MKNKYIEVVKRFRSGEAISVEALNANSDAADAAYDAIADAYIADDAAYDAIADAYIADAADAAFAAASAAAYAALYAVDAADAADADHWVKRYEELLSNEQKNNEK